MRSPSTWRFDVGVKKAGYERHGLQELWLVDTVARTVLVYRRSSAGCAAFDVALELAEDERLTCPLLPGFALAVADIFRLPERSRITARTLAAPTGCRQARRP